MSLKKVSMIDPLFQLTETSAPKKESITENISNQWEKEKGKSQTFSNLIQTQNKMQTSYHLQRMKRSMITTVTKI